MKTESKKIVYNIKLGDIEVSTKDIEENKPFVEFNSYYQSAYSFIKDWISGKEEFYITTSGSTGTPKKILITRKQMIASAVGTAKALDLSASYRSLVCINTNYIGGMMMIVRSLELGMEMTILEPVSNPLKIIGNNERFDFTAVVPLQLESMINDLPNNEDIFNNFKCIIVGGAQVSYSLLSAISKVSVPIYATYGMTETISHIALQRLNGKEQRDHFTTIDNVIIKTDERGCLLIKAPMTNNVWISTNDIVDLIDDQNFRYLGRYDNVINSGGVKVQPEVVEGKLEKVFTELGLLRRFFVFGTQDERLGQKVCLFIEGEPLHSSVEKSLSEKMKSILPPYHTPRQIVFIPTFAETANGKVDKRKMAKSFST